MKDIIGTEVEVGDIIVAAAARQWGEAKLGQVYAFNKSGSPMVKYIGRKWGTEVGRWISGAWRKGEAGSNVLVLKKHNSNHLPAYLADRLELDYDADEPSLLG